MKVWFFAILGSAVAIGVVLRLAAVIDRETALLFFGFVFGFFSSIPVLLLIIATGKPKSVAVNGDHWIPSTDDFDDSDYVMAKPVKPVTPIVVMRREPGAKWQIVEDNR